MHTSTPIHIEQLPRHLIWARRYFFCDAAINFLRELNINVCHNTNSHLNTGTKTVTPTSNGDRSVTPSPQHVFPLITFQHHYITKLNPRPTGSLKLTRPTGGGFRRTPPTNSAPIGRIRKRNKAFESSLKFIAKVLL